MTEPTDPSTGLAKVNATENADEKNTNASDESRNTGYDANSFNKGVDVGFAKGANKGRRELLTELGIEDVDGIKAAVEFKREHEESQKSATERLANFEDENKELKAILGTYQERDLKSATEIFEQLSEEDQVTIKEADIPIEKMVPVMKRMISAKPSPLKDVGTAFSPAPDESPTVSKPNRTGLDPAYKKDPDSFIQRKVEEFNRKNQN